MKITVNLAEVAKYGLKAMSMIGCSGIGAAGAIMVMGGCKSTVGKLIGAACGCVTGGLIGTMLDEKIDEWFYLYEQTTRYNELNTSIFDKWNNDETEAEEP